MANINNYFRTNFLRLRDLFKSPEIFPYLLAAILISIPLNYAFGSITSIIFVVVSFSSLQKLKFKFNKVIILPILLYFIMALSLLWTQDFKATLSGLQKELPLFFMPLVFLFIPLLTKRMIYKTFRIFSFGMTGFALFYFAKALLRYISTGDKSVFFYHELVTLDVNAIYVSVFASFALFYFVAIRRKTTIERIALTILIVLVFLLSSKSIITIDCLMIVLYYSVFSDVPKSVRTTTLIAVILFIGSSLFFVKEVKERFLLEYQTAFVDNTINNQIGNADAKVYNVSLSQAWNDDKFEANKFFPGTALRVYQFRIFTEMLAQDNILFTGYGLEASQEKIRAKTLEHNLYNGYGDFNFHNQYVQTFAELGVFAFIILLLMQIFNLRRALTEKDFLHIAFAVTMIILFLTESFFCRQRGVLFFTTIYCMFNAFRASEEKA